MKPYSLLLAFGPALISGAAFGRGRGHPEAESKGFPPGFGGLTRDGEFGQLPIAYNLSDSQHAGNGRIDGSFWVNAFVRGSNGHDYYMASHVQDYASDIEGARPSYRAAILDITNPSFYRQYVKVVEPGTEISFWDEDEEFRAVFEEGGMGMETANPGGDPLTGVRTWSKIEGVEFDFTFNFSAPAVLNAALGAYPVSGGWGYEWSLPKGATSGWLKIDGEVVDIVPEKSSTWFDRQWGALQDNFTWFMINFGDDPKWFPYSTLVCWDWQDAVYGRKEFATVRSAESGRDTVVPIKILESEEGVYTSPDTGREYPQQFVVEIDDVEIHLKTPRPDQVFEAPADTGFPPQLSGYIEVEARKPGHRPFESAAPPPKFYFVPSNGLQQAQEKSGKPESQRYLTAARKHVMRDIGFSRRRGKRNRTAVVEVDLAVVQQPQSSPVKAEDDAKQLSNRACLTLQHVPTGLEGGRLDPFVKWPVDITKRMRCLLDHFFTTNCKTLIPLRSVAGTLLSLDVGLFHHALAISGFCLSARYRGSEKAALSAEAFHHYSTGLNSVNSRLGDVRQQHSDGVVLSIMGIAIHTLTPSAKQGWCWEIEQSSSQDGANFPDQWALHMRAIRTILAKRGGVRASDSNVTLRHWLYLMDLEGSITRDVSPFFPIPSYISAPSQDLRSPRETDVMSCESKLTQELPGASEAIAILADLDSTTSWLTWELESSKGGVWLDLSVDTTRLLPLIHRCLGLSRKHALCTSMDGDVSRFNKDQCFSDAIRHAIVLFLAPVRRYFGPPASGTELHVNRITEALQGCLDHRSALRLQRLIFWMIAVAAVEACTLALDASWFFERILDMCAIVGAREFHEIRSFIEHATSQVMWFGVAMAPGLSLMMEKLRVVVLRLREAADGQVYGRGSV